MKKTIVLLSFCFTCVTFINAQQTGTFKDLRDGNVYKTVTIGEQVWMAENLNYETSSGSWCYNDDPANCEKYGRLYDWETAMNVCPDGWHLPSDDDWTELTDYLGGEDVAGGKLKATGTIEAGTGLWNDPNTGATNETGFTALPGGRRFFDGSFYSADLSSNWWSSTQNIVTLAWYYTLHWYSCDVDRSSRSKSNGLSVRCLRDVD